MKRVFYIIIFVGLYLISNGQNYLIYNHDKTIELSDDGIEHFERTLPTSVDITGSEAWPPIYQQVHWVCNQVAASYYMLTFETNLRKGLNSSLPENQYSIYFPWNLGNGGTGWFGDNYIITMELFKSLGVPLAIDSEADIHQDSSIWMNGYDKYFDAMHNRISDYYRIKVNTVNGLTTLKSWVYNHGGSEYYGGTGTFLANVAEEGATEFENGLPEEGSHVITKCGDDALHARTIVGYNDLVCFDYNNDGQYTNDIDLNGDGLINVQDYEKGGFKLAESFGPDWYGSGYCWIMYKCLADEYPNGGILNNYIHVIEPNIEYTPKITAKVRIKHPSRERVKIKIGISTDMLSETYNEVKDFPIFNFQGGDRYAQGGTNESDKTIEIGLDLSDFANYFNDTDCAKLFLEVLEADPDNNYSGEILEFTIIDYTSGSPIEFVSDDASCSMNNNSSTLLSVDVCLNDNNAPLITTDIIPIFDIDDPLWFPLEKIQGTPPYIWEILPYFEYTESNFEFDAFDGTRITPNEEFNGDLILDIPFYFPFNNNESNSIKISSDGYIFPFSSTHTWTQFREYLYPFFINEKVIAPLARFSLVNAYDFDDGIWYEFVQDTVKIRWKSSDNSSEAWTNVEFACNLLSNGTIEFIYGVNHLNTIFSNIGGISFGNQSDNIICYYDDIPDSNTKLKIKPYPIPQNLHINENGVLYGTLGEYNAYPFRVKITDANGMNHTVKYELTTSISDVLIPDELFEIYPNPVSDALIIKFNDDESLAFKMTLYSNAGDILLSKEVYTKKINRVDITEFPSGIYFVVIEKDGMDISRSFVKI